MDNKKERILEKKKAETEFELAINDFERRGFKIEACTFSLARVATPAVNIIAGIIGFIFGLTLTMPALSAYNPLSGEIRFVLPNIIFSVVIFFAVIVPLHELIHAIGFIMRGKKWKENISFGVSIKKMVASCHCSSPMSGIDYFIGVILPFAVLGVGLFVAGIIFGSKILLLVSIVSAVTSAGDLMIVYLLFKKRPSLILDHPTEIGFVAIYE